jgi:hypothetical protein
MGYVLQLPAVPDQRSLAADCSAATLAMQTLLGMVVFQPLLCALQHTTKYLQGRDVYFGDMAAAIEGLQTDLHRLYINPDTAYTGGAWSLLERFLAGTAAGAASSGSGGATGGPGSSGSGEGSGSGGGSEGGGSGSSGGSGSLPTVDLIVGGLSGPQRVGMLSGRCYLGFVQDCPDERPTLRLFVRGREQEGGYVLSYQPARRHHRAVQPPAQPVSQGTLLQLLAEVKAAACNAAKAVLQEVKERLLPSKLAAAFAVVQPQYWLRPDAVAELDEAIAVLSEQYGTARTICPSAAQPPQPQMPAGAAAAAPALDSPQAQLAQLQVVSAAAAAAAQSGDAATAAALHQAYELAMQYCASIAPRVPAQPPPAPAAPQAIPVGPVIDRHQLAVQADTFKALMLQRARRYEDWPAQQAAAAERGAELPCATEHLWALLEATPSVLERISEWHKVAELVLCQPVGSVENERRFSSMNNIKTKLRNRLGAAHLNACMRIHASECSYDTFPFNAAFDRWRQAKPRRGL